MNAKYVKFLSSNTCLVFGLLMPVICIGQELKNNQYRITLKADNSIEVNVEGVEPQILRPEFTVMYSSKDPGYSTNHLNYFISPRVAIRWSNCQQDLKSLNDWLNSPDMQQVAGSEVVVTEDKNGNRTWLYKNVQGGGRNKVQGPYANGTTNPFFAGQKTTLTAKKTYLKGDSIVWEFEEQPDFTLTGRLMLPVPLGDPQITYDLIVKKAGYYSVAFTGVPSTPADKAISVPQECGGKGGRQLNFAMCEGYMKLPRAHIATEKLNSVIIVDPNESPFRIPDRSNSRFSVMIERTNSQLKPIIFAPIMGGYESQMKTGNKYSFTVRYVLRPGDWKDTYRYLARNIYGFRDMRDNSGPGSLNNTLENILDYLIDRDGHNYAMWDPEQKYHYYCDKPGVFKPFSPLFGMSVVLVTDDEELYKKKVRPIVEFAVSRKSNIFSPYETFDNGQIKSRNRELGSPYPSTVQLTSLSQMFQGRTYAFKFYIEQKGFSKSDFIDLLSQYRMTGNKDYLSAAVKVADRMTASRSAGDYMNFIEIYEETKDEKYLKAAVEGAYARSAAMNLFPVVPDTFITVDKNNEVPIHAHSYGRHKVWGFPPPKPFHAPQQTVPAWRVALTGFESPAYRGEFWLNNNGQLMRLATYAKDDFLRDFTRWAMVGRFANYAGDNRSKISLVIEQPDAPLHPLWETDYATFNPGHSWEFVGAVIDFLISDAFNRSEKQIDFPSRCMYESGFRVKAYGDRPGQFYDENNVQLWLPRHLLKSDNKQVDYVAGYGNGKFYLAFWNQSFKTEDVTITLNSDLVECNGAHKARIWQDNKDKGTIEISDNTVKFTISPKGIVAYAIEGVKVKPRLQAKMFDKTAVTLGKDSLVTSDAPFGKVTAMLITMGKGLTSSFVYTDALPENVISAKLKYRQGNGPWQEKTDAIFPYEFSSDIDESKGDFQCIFEVETAEQQVQRSEIITLKF